MVSKLQTELELIRCDGYWKSVFMAMASPCEVLLQVDSEDEAGQLASLALQEARRIERKFSRYRGDNIVRAINSSNGRPIAIDEETGRMLQYAAQCYDLSGGRFDVTSGILRRAWRFDGGEFAPDQRQIEVLLESVGWVKVELKPDSIRLRPGMEIDLGGIGKEYAADRVADQLFQECQASLMVNFGGDIRAIAADTASPPWIIGIEDPHHDGGVVGSLEVANGATATSGDARRFCLVDGRRLGHILNPHTGWPVANAPRSVTVIADYCTEAGFLATLAILNGADAESFLTAQGVVFHCVR